MPAAQADPPASSASSPGKIPNLPATSKIKLWFNPAIVYCEPAAHKSNTGKRGNRIRSFFPGFAGGGSENH
jgi:hypothetical protein